MPSTLQESKRILLLGLIPLLGAVLVLVIMRSASGHVVSVCATGCDFSTVQDAIDDPGTSAGSVIAIQAAVHTEAGIVVNKHVTIQGQGPIHTVVQAHADIEEATERVFYVVPDAEVTIRKMTIRHGNPSSEPRSGGGIRNEGKLTVSESIIDRNKASAGGGIFNSGTLSLVNVTVSNNTAMGGDRYLECNTGGGIKNMEGLLTMTNSTVRDNTSRGKGSGFHIACLGKLVLVNSTVSGNHTTNDGGGVFVNGAAEFINSTIVNNSAHNGGGVYVRGTGEAGVVRGVLSFTNTIIADNGIRFTEYGDADCFLGDHASIDVNRNNLVEDGSCEPEYATDPRLSPLEGAEGDTQAYAPSSDSPVVDAIQPDQCIVITDQRGLTRPSGEGCDIGSIEIQAAADKGAQPWWNASLLLIIIFASLVIFWRLRKRGSVDDK